MNKSLHVYVDGPQANHLQNISPSAELNYRSEVQNFDNLHVTLVFEFSGFKYANIVLLELASRAVRAASNCAASNCHLTCFLHVWFKPI